MTSKLEIDSLRIRNSGSVPLASTPGSAGDLIWSGSYLYVCVAENTWKRVPIGSWSAPDQVTGLTIDSTGDATIDLSWTQPSSDDPIIDYVIEYTPSGGIATTVLIGSAATSYQITGLTNDTEYTVRVAAVSAAGTGAYSTAATGTPSAFTPDSLSGLQLWLDASDSSTLYDATTGGSLVAADGTVKRWEDKSGNGRHATEATNGPQRKAAVQGGLDVLRFDGANDKLSIPSSTATFKFLHSTQATVFFVSKPTPATDDTLLGCLLATFNVSSSEIGYALFYEDREFPADSFIAEDALRCLVARGVGGELAIDTLDSGAGLFTPNEFTAASVVTDCTAASGADRIAAFVNGADQQPVNSATNAASTSNSGGELTIGSHSSPGAFFPGDIAEIIIYNSALSDTDRQAVESYLMTKWGIA